MGLHPKFVWTHRPLAPICLESQASGPILPGSTRLQPQFAQGLQPPFPRTSDPSSSINSFINKNSGYALIAILKIQMTGGCAFDPQEKIIL